MERMLTSKQDQPPRHQYVVDPDHPNKMIDLGTVGVNDNVHVLSREPRQPASEVTPQLMTRNDIPVDPNDPTKGVRTESRWLKPGQTWDQGTDIGGHVAKGGGPVPKPDKVKPLYDDKALKNFQTLMARAGNSESVRKGRESAENAFINLISDSDVKADVKQIREDKGLRMMTPDKLRAAITPPNSIKNDPVKSKEYVDKVSSILSLLPRYPRLQDENR
jgi:hypothetical protein